MFAAPPPFPAAFVTIPFHFYVWQLHIVLLIASTISTALSFQTDFSSRSKRGFVPVPWFFATRYLYIFSSPLTLFFFFLYRKEITFRDEFIHESRDIEDIFFPFFFVPSLKNSENLEIKPYKKKKIAFSLLLSTMLKREEDVWVKQGEARKILIIHRLASIMKPSWSDGRRNTNCPLCPPTFKTCSRRRRRACWFPFHSASCSRARDR